MGTNASMETRCIVLWMVFGLMVRFGGDVSQVSMGTVVYRQVNVGVLETRCCRQHSKPILLQLRKDIFWIHKPSHSVILYSHNIH